MRQMQLGCHESLCVRTVRQRCRNCVRLCCFKEAISQHVAKVRCPKTGRWICVVLGLRLICPISSRVISMTPHCPGAFLGTCLEQSKQSSILMMKIKEHVNCHHYNHYTWLHTVTDDHTQTPRHTFLNVACMISDLLSLFPTAALLFSGNLLLSPSFGKTALP